MVARVYAQLGYGSIWRDNGSGQAVCIPLDDDLVAQGVGDGNQVAFLVIAELVEDNTRIPVDGLHVYSFAVEDMKEAVLGKTDLPDGLVTAEGIACGHLDLPDAVVI